MIPTLFEAGSITFTSNGLGGLPDAISCTVTEERNGQYYLEMEYPQNGRHHADLGVDRIICAAPAPNKAPQPFVIERLQSTIDGITKIYASCYIMAILRGLAANCYRVNDGTATYTASQAMARIWNNSSSVGVPGLGAKVFFHSDPNFTRKNIKINAFVIPALEGFLGVEGSVLDTWGGEYTWDVFDIYLFENRGKDTGIEIRYGANMSKLDSDVDISDLVTGVRPFWENDVHWIVGAVTLADNRDAFSFNRVIPLDTRDILGTDEQPTNDAVTQAGADFIAKTTRKNPYISIEAGVSPVILPKFDTNPPPGRDVYLCDTVTVVHPGLGIRQKAKIVKCVFNTLTEQYESITVGSIRKDISDTIASLI